MRQNDLGFANFILRFGIEEVMLDYAEEIVIPAFTDTSLIRTYGETQFSFFNVRFSQIDKEKDGLPILALSGHFVKDTVLRRQQIFRRDRGLVEDEFAIESAPSSFFILILNNHRLLYFAETAAAPPLDAFATTAQQFLRLKYRDFLRDRLEHDNVTRRGVDRVTLSQLQKRIPPPVLTVVPVAGQDTINEILQRFRIVKQIRLKLIQPNDEIDASEAMAGIEQAFRPLRPKRLEVVAADPQGLDKVETARAVNEASAGHNTEILIEGEDEAGLKLKADNEEFALTMPIDNPPDDDGGLRAKIVDVYNTLVDLGKVRKLPTPAQAIDKINQLLRRA